MDKEAFLAELKMLGIRCGFLDIAAWCISNLFLGLNYHFALGLLLGTAALFVNLFILKHSIDLMAYDAKRTGQASTKRHMAYYLLRMAVFSAVFVVSLLFPSVFSPIGVAVPQIFPRLIYTAQAVRGKNK